MKIDEFINNVLVDIHNGIKKAGKTTDRDYYVQIGSNGGVTFDIAVTTVNAQGSQTENKSEAGAKLGFIEVVGAKIGSNIGTKSENKIENSEISRIKFTVFVPIQTETEQESARREAQNSSPEWIR